MNFGFWEIWSPDIRCWSVLDGADMSRSVGRDPLRVNNDGLVSWWTRAVIRSECAIDLTDFPFDQQSCSIYMGSWTYDSMHLNLTANNKFQKQVYGPFSRNPEWAVMKKDVYQADLNQSEVAAWHSLGIELVLARRTEMYKYRVGIPYFTAWAFALFSFMSEVGSSRRLLFSAIAILVYLILMVQMAIQLGPHSIHTPYAVRCLGVSLVVVTASLIFSATINHISYSMTKSNTVLPRFLTVFLDSRVLKTLLCLREPDTSTPASLDTRLLDARSSALIGREWLLMRQFADRFCFLCFVATALFYHS